MEKHASFPLLVSWGSLERNFQNSFMRPGHALHGWNPAFSNFTIHKVLFQSPHAVSISAIHVQSTQSIVLKVPLESYFSIRSSTVQPRFLARRCTVSMLALLISLFRCSYI